MCLCVLFKTILPVANLSSTKTLSSAQTSDRMSVSTRDPQQRGAVTPPSTEEGDNPDAPVAFPAVRLEYREQTQLGERGGVQSPAQLWGVVTVMVTLRWCAGFLVLLLSKPPEPVGSPASTGLLSGQNGHLCTPLQKSSHPAPPKMSTNFPPWDLNHLFIMRLC